MNGSVSPEFERVLGLLPTMTCVLTSAFEQRRGGVLVRRAMQCADEPVCIAVAVPTGHRIATLIRDSHTFAICLLDRSNRLLMRKFDGREEGDPFDTIETLRLVSTSPIPARALAAIDCEVVRHYDLEADHEIYVGQVLAVRGMNMVMEPVATEQALSAQHAASSVVIATNGHAAHAPNGQNGHHGQNGHTPKPVPAVPQAAAASPVTPSIVVPPVNITRVAG